jgi:hypothetical protein
MAIIALKAWYLEEYEPIRELEKRAQDLRLSKNSLLKSALRADFLDDAEAVKQSAWFQRYLEGEIVEFYIEGSGGYAISNIDLISHEIYFTKREVLSHHEPQIFFSYQPGYPESSQILRQELVDAIEKLNKRSRFPLTLAESNRLSEGALRLKSTLMRKLRQSLIFIADGTPLVGLDSDPPQLLPHPAVCVELGYALQCKRPEQILLAQMERADLPGQFPFDTTSDQRLRFKAVQDLRKPLVGSLERCLKRFALL